MIARSNIRNYSIFLKDTPEQVRLTVPVKLPELAITGYPPEDLLLKPKFLLENRRALQEVVRQSRGLAVVVGFLFTAGPRWLGLPDVAAATLRASALRL